jgi:rSAM/selenodomain-associated transferase 1
MTVDKSVDKVDNSANRHIINHSGPVIGLFAKQPVPGQVKTRMTPPLSPQQASRLYSTALRETLSRLQKVNATLVVCYAGERSWFQAVFPGLPLLAQQGEGLTERMSNAVHALFDAGGAPVLLAGSDSPDMPLGLLNEAIALLQRRDVVCVPCRDGGYAIVGLRQPTTELFAGIPWSTPLVLDATRQRCRELGLSYDETAGWDDLDDVADLQRLVERSPGSLTAQHIVAELAVLF